MNNYYTRVMRFIDRRFVGEDKEMLIRYFNSDVFEEDIEKFMNLQINAGEPITKEFATQCLLESYKDRNDEEDASLTPSFFK